MSERSEEQRALAQTMIGMLGDQVNLESAKSEKLTPVPLAPWVDAGLTDLLTDGGTVVDLAVVAEELGRAAAPYPLVELALGAYAATRAGFATDGPVLLVAGTSREVPWIDGVEHVVRVEGSALSCHAVVGRARRRVLDLSRDWVDLDLLAPTASVDDAELASWLGDALDTLSVVDALGAAERLLALTIEHVSSREQFGEVIGRFQAVKHHAADMRVGLATSRASLERAVDALLDGSDQREAVSGAVVHAAPALSAAASTALQLHGGMGFTWEHDLHLFLRRVTTAELRGELVPRHIRRYAKLLG